MIREVANYGLCCGWVLLALTSCRKDLCYDHDEHECGYRTQVAASWDQAWEREYGRGWADGWDAAAMGASYDELRPGIPAGLAVAVYAGEAGGDLGSRATMKDEYHLPPAGGSIYTGEGSCSLLFYNDDTEYIVFNDLSLLPSASATTRTRTRASYSMDEAHADERTVSPPDLLYGAYRADYRAEFLPGWQELPVTLRPLTYTYLVRYEFEQGLEYVELARGALAGMAESVYLQDGRTGDRAATLLYDCTLTAYGAEARVLSFGAPAFPDSYYNPQRAGEAERSYGLQLEVRLTNGKTVSRDFDISDQMAQQPRGGVITVKGIRITSEESASGGSSFDVTVDGWGEYEDIDMPL